MRATVMHGRHDVQIENVNNATIQEPTGECRVRQSGPCLTDKSISCV